MGRKRNEGRKKKGQKDKVEKRRGHAELPSERINNDFSSNKWWSHSPSALSMDR